MSDAKHFGMISMTWEGLEYFWNFGASLASYLGLLVSVYTLVLVWRLRTALMRHSRHRQITELIDQIQKLPDSKPVLTKSTAGQVESIIKTLKIYDLSPFTFRQRQLKKTLEELEQELKDGKRVVAIKNLLKLVQDEITIR